MSREKQYGHIGRLLSMTHLWFFDVIRSSLLKISAHVNHMDDV